MSNNHQSLLIILYNVMVRPVSRLGDADLALLLLLGLGNNDAEDTVLHRGADFVLVNPLGEVE